MTDLLVETSHLTVVVAVGICWSSLLKRCRCRSALLNNFLSASLKRNGSRFKVKILPFREPCLFNLFVLVLMVPSAIWYEYHQNRVDLLLHRAEAPKLWTKR
jgi:hydrogenase/urease accessory protein HupE